MEASYKYEVYFECPNMDSERIRKLEKYFQITRKSGGGECGRLEVFKGNVYKIAFKDQNVQLRVLEKRDHVSSQFPSIIVHGTPQFPLHDLSTVTTTTPKADNPKVGLSSPPETEFPVAASPSPPIVQNQEVHLESLKEASVARQHLEEELLSIGSPNQLQLDKDRVIVSGTGQVQPDGDGFKHGEDREEQGVDKVKERPSQADMVDIVSHMQGQPAEIQRASLSDQPAPRYYTGPAAREAQGAKGSHSYVLPRGVRVLVCHGDITKETADALVNAANRNLNHAGGVAAALSWAGGFEVQRESTALVKEHGPYATGDAVMTTGGNLKCRKLIHIVGPIQGEANGQERPLITRSVGSALKLADYNQFRSIAIPCISSGIFQVPISVCAEAIVTAVLHFGRQSQYLKTITLIDTREEVVKALHVACDRIFSSANAELEAAGDRQFQESTGASGPWSNSGASPVNPGEEVRIMTWAHQPPPGNPFPSSHRNEETQNETLSYKPLKQHVHQEDMGPSAKQVQGAKGSHYYVLPGGVKVFVCHGDITKERADALVNSANGNLSHDGGVAAALSHAGGSEVQRESTALVKEHGAYATGEAVMTTGGNLQCRKLIHIVRPAQGEENGRERLFLKKSVWSALKLADDNQFQSIAMPCISSGIFQVPISVCAEAIVTAVLHFGRQSQHLNKIILIDKREEVVKALHVACNSIFVFETAETAGGHQVQENIGASGPWSNAGANPLNTGTDFSSIQLKTTEGLIEEQQVDVIVLPMKDHDPRSTGLGKRMSEIIGPRLEAAFQKREKECQLPVEVDVDGLTKLHCRKVFFVNLLPWDRQHSETAVQALKQGFQHVLTSCQKQEFGSIAFPKLGTGEVLQFPWHVVESALVKEIGTHELNRHSWPLKIHIVVHPSDNQTNKAMPPQQIFPPHSNAAPRASFSGYASTNLKMATAMVGGVQFELFHGDIVHEKTDVIVNTIQKSVDQSGVSKAILKAAGTHVKDEFGAKLGACSQQSDILFSTGPGLLECKEILHGTFYNDAKTICETCENILKRCEYDHYSSVSFPALGTGAGKMDHDKACNTMLDGIEAAVRSMSPTYLKLVRIVVMRKPVYKDFRTVLQYRCDETARQQQGQDAIRQPPPAVSDWEFIGSSSGHVSQYSNLQCSIS